MGKMRSVLIVATLGIAACFGLIVAAPPSATPVPPSVGAVAYDRGLYKHWIDADHDCQDTRQEVLISESVIPVTLDAKGCVVLKGEWHDPYTGLVFTDPKKLDVDHLVPLAEAHSSGGFAWDPKRRQDYANNLTDPNTLIAVSLSANRAKGDKDPAKWLPANVAFRCTYAGEWIEVKQRWGMTMDAAEKRTVDTILAGCRAATDPTVTASVPTPRIRPFD
jgi:hypothetical protein